MTKNNSKWMNPRDEWFGGFAPEARSERWHAAPPRMQPLQASPPVPNIPTSISQPARAAPVCVPTPSPVTYESMNPDTMPIFQILVERILDNHAEVEDMYKLKITLCMLAKTAAHVGADTKCIVDAYWASLPLTRGTAIDERVCHAGERLRANWRSEPGATDADWEAWMASL